MTRDEAIQVLTNFYVSTKNPKANHLCEAVYIAIQALKNKPKHGRWIWNKRLGEWYCSNCDMIMNPYTVEKSEGEYEMAQPSYCGWCGARMDEVENGD